MKHGDYIMTKQIKISIVMATYNGEQFLIEQLDSLFQQTILPDELIILDDCSLDSKRNILDTYSAYPKEIKIKKVYRKKHVGYIRNFLDGIKQATGEIVFLCDQDDIWKEDKIERCLAFFKDYSDCVVLHTNTAKIDVHGDIIEKNLQKYDMFSRRLTLEELVTKVNYPGMSMCFRREAVEEYLSRFIEQGIVFPTHDWVIAYIGCLLDGFYTSNQVLTYSRYTGHHVALTQEKKRISTVSRRVKGIAIYREKYQFVSDVQNKNILHKTLNAERFLQVSNNRENYLTNHSLADWFKNIRNITYYPSKKTYLADGLLLLRGRKS
ncbi:glycosyltransferase [Streptococcus hyointestinalis]|uniref:glycosyltransferase n=1 Tax=Streptococcus hyointestinalis TaxID=1337 RepID=UPI0013E00A51|nr:glycosyltransferase [Streptococcus hyointestinalis]